MYKLYICYFADFHSGIGSTYTQNIELGPGRLLVAGAAADGPPLVTL